MIKRISKNLTIEIPGPNIEITHYITDLFGEILKPRIEKKKDKLAAGKSILNTLYGKETKNTFKKPKLTKKEKFIADLFRTSKEVHDSFLRLELTIKLANNVGSMKAATKNELLHYFYENFINEFYISTERVKNLLIIIEKQAEKLKLYNEYRKLVILRNNYHNIYNSLKITRNNHNHKYRYTDKNFERLNTIEIFKIFTKDEWMNAYFKHVYKDIKYTTIKTLKNYYHKLELGSNTALNIGKTILINDILPLMENKR